MPGSGDSNKEPTTRYISPSRRWHQLTSHSNSKEGSQKQTDETYDEKRQLARDRSKKMNDDLNAKAAGRFKDDASKQVFPLYF